MPDNTRMGPDHTIRPQGRCCCWRKADSMTGQRIGVRELSSSRPVGLAKEACGGVPYRLGRIDATKLYPEMIGYIK
jgi:hypothetical protein